jgi:hypothetical protein
MAMSLSKMFTLERKASAALSATKINNYLLFWYVAKRHKFVTPFLMFCKHFASFFNLVGSSSKKLLQCGIIYVLSSKYFNIQKSITVSQRRRRRRRRILLGLRYPHHMFPSTACKFTVL